MKKQAKKIRKSTPKIKYKDLGRTYATKEAAENTIKGFRLHANNILDRAYVKKTAKGYSIMYYTFSDEIRRTIRAIERLSALTSKVYDYHVIAMKSEKWIEATYKKLIPLANLA